MPAPGATSLVALATRSLNTRLGLELARSVLTTAPRVLRPAISQTIGHRAKAFSTTSAAQYATHHNSGGAPTPGFRINRDPTWEEGESALDKAGRYFLMMEMMRGMYVVLEQFFRAP